MVKLVLLATVSLNGTKLTFSLVGLMLICLKKVHNKRSTLVNWSKKLVSNLTKLTLQYWNVRSKLLTWLLEASDQLWVPVEKSWRLNERHYGGLTGKNKQKLLNNLVMNKFTSGVVLTTYCLLQWTVMMNTQHTDRRYASLDDSVIPDAENLKVTLERALPFWEDKIAPALKDGKNVFVGAHGNSIRALVKHIKQLSDDEIMDVEIPNFPPLVFEFDEKLNVVKNTILENKNIQWYFIPPKCQRRLIQWSILSRPWKPKARQL